MTFVARCDLWYENPKCCWRVELYRLLS